MTFSGIIVAAGSASATEPQMILSHHLWLTDSDLATLNLVQAGLGWAYLPHPLVAALIDSGTLQAVAYKDGRRWAEDTVHTTGKAAKLLLSATSRGKAWALTPSALACATTVAPSLKKTLFP